MSNESKGVGRGGGKQPVKGGRPSDNKKGIAHIPYAVNTIKKNGKLTQKKVSVNYKIKTVSVKNNTKPVKAAVRRLLDKVRVKVLEKTKDNSPAQIQKGTRALSLMEDAVTMFTKQLPDSIDTKYNNILQQLNKDVESIAKKLDTKISLDTIPAELEKICKDMKKYSQELSQHVAPNQTKSSTEATTQHVESTQENMLDDFDDLLHQMEDIGTNLSAPSLEDRGKEISGMNRVLDDAGAALSDSIATITDLAKAHFPKANTKEALIAFKKSIDEGAQEILSIANVISTDEELATLKTELKSLKNSANSADVAQLEKAITTLENKKRLLVNILDAFKVWRADIGNVQNSKDVEHANQKLEAKIKELQAGKPNVTANAEITRAEEPSITGKPENAQINKHAKKVDETYTAETKMANEPVVIGRSPDSKSINKHITEATTHREKDRAKIVGEGTEGVNSPKIDKHAKMELKGGKTEENSEIAALKNTIDKQAKEIEELKKMVKTNRPKKKKKNWLSSLKILIPCALAIGCIIALSSVVAAPAAGAVLGICMMTAVAMYLVASDREEDRAQESALQPGGVPRPTIAPPDDRNSPPQKTGEENENRVGKNGKNANLLVDNPP